ncbi:MAG: fibronectin type III domain-containing protein [Candidatus Eisenbacteria bacterium]|nr:fibronectin type III domain-containing protein [Candidatus Eisenbacteria bacterium]
MRPPTNVVAKDTPGDAGRSITATWNKSSDDIEGGIVSHYKVFRQSAVEKGWKEIAEVPKGLQSIEDTSVADGVKYYYRVSAVDNAGGVAESFPSPAASSEGNWFNTRRINVLSMLILFFLLVILFMERAKRGLSLFVRKIAGFQAIEEAIGRATEMGRPVLYVPGIDDANNIQTIYSMVILNNVAKMVAKYETPLIVPVCRAFVLPLAEETVRQGYLDAGRPDAYNADNIRYLSDEQFAFTAAVDGIMLRERPAANLFFGSFFAESLILAETGASTGAIQVAGTANIHQLPFFVVACDYTLIGEEFFAATAYLSKEPKLIGTLKGSDWMKLFIIILLVIGSAFETIGIHSFSTWFIVQ